MIEDLISRVFHAQHKALGHFYDDVIEALDDIVEAYQGAFELVGTIPAPDKSDNDILKHLEVEAAWIEENHEGICKGNRAIANQIDALSGVYLSTVYKLRNLK